MCPHKSNEDPFSKVIYLYDQSKLVTAYIEHNSATF